MANVDNPHGFWPIARTDGGQDYVKIMTKLAAYGTAVGLFDPVVYAGTQNNLERGANAARVFGISLRGSAASTLATHPVLVLDNAVIAEAQEDGVGGAMGVDAEQTNADFIVAAANSTTLISQVEIDSSTAATTNTLGLKLFKVAPYPDNDGALTNARWFVKFNNLTTADQAAGV